MLESIYIPFSNEIGVYEAEKWGVNACSQNNWCLTNHWILFDVAEYVCPLNPTEDYDLRPNWVYNNLEKGDNNLQNVLDWRNMYFMNQSQNIEGEIEWVIILQLKAQSPPIQIGHQGMNPCTWGSPSCRLSKGCRLHAHWSAPEVLTKWLMQVWTPACRTGASWAPPK